MNLPVTVYVVEPNGKVYHRHPRCPRNWQRHAPVGLKVAVKVLGLRPCGTCHPAIYRDAT